MGSPRRPGVGLLPLTLGLVACAVAACGSAASPAAPATSSSPTALPPATSSAPFVVDLPIAESDSTSQAYAIWPFGVHDGSHGLDGHLGFDIEYRVGARVLAAASGTVASVTTDPHDPSRRVVDLRHASARGTYTTGYSNLIDVPGAVVPGAPVARGEPWHGRVVSRRPVRDDSLPDGGSHAHRPRDRKSTRLNSSHVSESRMPSSA